MSRTQISALSRTIIKLGGERADIRAEFGTQLYLANNPDIAALRFNALEHYRQFGIFKGCSSYDDIIA